RTGAFLKMAERLPPALPVGHVDEKPRLAITQQQKINLPLGLVTHVTQLELAKAQIGPTLGGLEQVAGNERSCPRARLDHSGPVAQKPFWLLAQSLRDALKPRTHAKAELEALEQIHPAPDGIDRNSQLAA